VRRDGGHKFWPATGADAQITHLNPYGVLQLSSNPIAERKSAVVRDCNAQISLGVRHIPGAGMLRSKELRHNPQRFWSKVF
jgi:hypothetical protein